MKVFKVGELEVVDYIVEMVGNIGEGDWKDYKEGDLVEYRIKLEWFDMFCEGMEVEKLMKEFSDNELWEDFKIENGDYILNVERSINNGRLEEGEVYKVSYFSK
jgi:hypothetical protein